MAERLSIFNIEQTISRKRATMKMFETMLDGTKTLLRELEAKLTAEKQMQEARTWPEFALVEQDVLALMQADSDKVATAKKAGWTRAYEYDIKRAYAEVMGKLKAKRVAACMAAQRDQQCSYWHRHIGGPVVITTPAYLQPGVTLEIQPGFYWAEPKAATTLTPERYCYFPGARVSYKPNANKGPLWTGTVIVRPEGYCFPERSLVTGGELTYVIKDGTINIRGCFARNLVPAK